MDYLKSYLPNVLKRGKIGIFLTIGVVHKCQPNFIRVGMEGGKRGEGDLKIQVFCEKLNSVSSNECDIKIN